MYLFLTRPVLFGDITKFVCLNHLTFDENTTCTVYFCGVRAVGNENLVLENEKPVGTPRKVRLNRIASLIVNGCRDRLRLTPDCISLGFYYKHRPTEITRQHRRVTTAAKRWPLASAPVSMPLFACLVDCSYYTRRLDCVYIYSMFRNFSGY